MRKTLLSYDQVPQLAKTDVAYAMGDPRLQAFYQYTPHLEAMQQAISDRQTIQYPRADLVKVLKTQYATLPPNVAVQANIEALAEAGTFTVTTAHQPFLLLGPLYFVYKALTTIRLAEETARFTGKRIVPVFVLGSEDHDLEELNQVQLYSKKITWEPGETGPVGSMSLAAMPAVLETLKEILGNSEAAEALYARLARTYDGPKDFAAATQALLHEWLGKEGLVVLNMNSAVLKRHFIPVMRAELLEQRSFQLVNQTIEQLTTLGFKTQAAPREINLFYMQPGLRERIVREGDAFKVNNTKLVFSQTEILTELEKHPEHFSPNVVLRPLFQETILPNLAYVGGGGELAYWLERKKLFESFACPFPMLVRRNSVLWLDTDSQKKLAKFGYTPSEFFNDTETLVRQFIERNATADISLGPEVAQLRTVYNQLASKASQVDPTLEKAIRAEEVKAIAGLEQWESRLIRAEKQKHEVVIQQMRALKEKLFPGNGLQERSENCIPYLLKYGDDYLQMLKDNLQPFDPGFVILEI
jgi:bacillithiol biosynthesis cysteine-adding enzyme BshC